ncbi:MAG: 3-dehydroquinate synthase [Chthonomonadales bacterium]
MKRVRVRLAARSYDIRIGPGILRHIAADVLEELRPSSVVLISHPKLADWYARPIAEGFGTHGVRTCNVTVPPGERHKNLRTVARLYKALVQAGADRQTLLVVVGGGVLGDVGGFVAATYMRSIPFIQVPTTLLAQVDASIGGKTGVDLEEGKNLIGAFYQPLGVYADTDTLATLPARELRCGLAEVVKYGIISDERLLAFVEAHAGRLLRRDTSALAHVVQRSCAIKARIVAADETERGPRAVLNFGHTVGHALEACTGYRRYRHGEAVAAGMVAAARVGELLGIGPAGIRERIVRVLQSLRLPTSLPANVAAEDLLAAMARDKKAVGGKLRMVLPRGIGDVVIVDGVDPGCVRRALAELQE